MIARVKSPTSNIPVASRTHPPLPSVWQSAFGFSVIGILLAVEIAWVTALVLIATWLV